MVKKLKKYNVNKVENQNEVESLGLILEEGKPLSQSMLWDMQRDFFSNQGPEAWIKGIVPQYITTNPFIANLYAKVTYGYLRDYVSRGDIDKTSTVYIMELASGVGRFTYIFLKRFIHLIENSPLKNIKFKYIVTDFSEKNIEYWQSHSFLKPFFDSGVLDCATFDISKDEELLLRHSGEVLSAGNLKNPLILFANYTFDSLPQDTFDVVKGELSEGLITLIRDEEIADPSDKSILAGLDYNYTDHLISGDNYYEDDNFNEILRYYKSRFADTAFSFPIIALRGISRLMKLFNDDIVLISVDKGYKNEKAMLKNSHPFLSKHGCVSMTVNFNAIENYFKNLGGMALHSIYEHVNVNMSLFLLSKSHHGFAETKMAYREIIEGIGPDDFYLIKKGIVSVSEALDTKQLLTLIRYTVWDSKTFLDCYNLFLERIDVEDNFPLEELLTVINRVWDNYFPIGEEDDLAYYIGALLCVIGYYKDALHYFMISYEFYGPSAEIYYKIALCYFNMGQFDMAMEYTDKSLELDPIFEETRTMKILIDGSSENNR
jgi:tetratricopeptide (TPR) repeat protein